MKRYVPHRYFWICAIGAFMILTAEVHAQRSAFMAYSLREGLVQSQARSLFQDSRGYLWVGTLGGVSRFNGTAFRNYDRSHGLLNNQVNSIAELHDGTIVVGTMGGISLITASGVRSFPMPEAFTGAAVNALYEDASGMLWVGTENGLRLFREGQYLESPSDGGPWDAHVKVVRAAADGGHWVVTRNAVMKYDQGMWKNVESSGDPEVHYFDVEEDGNGGLWVACRVHGLLWIGPSGERVDYGEREDLPSTTVTGIVRDHNGRPWFSCRFGFFYWNGERFIAWSEREGLPTPDIRDLLVDREGNLWLATNGSGLLRFTGESFSTYTRDDGLSSDAVMSIAQDSSGAMWYSTFDQGICRLEGDSIVRVAQKEVTGSSRIWTSLATSDGSVWFGSSDGLLQWRSGRFHAFTAEDSLPDRLVLSLASDGNGRLFIGTSEGPCVLENGRIRRLDALPGFPKTRVRGMNLDRAGNLWMATRDGVFRFDGNVFQAYGLEEGLPDLSGYCVAIDPSNRILVGTQMGLAVLEGERFRAIRFADEAGAGTVNFIHVSGGQWWIGTLNGLYSLPLDADPADRSSYRHYGIADGVSSLETNLNAVFTDRSGRVWFGTPEGVVRIDLAALSAPRPRVQPQIVLREVHLNLQSPDWKQFADHLDPITGLPYALSVSHANNHFTFYFEATATTYPEALQYQYRLEGLEEDWQPLTATPFATYNNLSAGDYTFQVRALGKEGLWSDTLSWAFTIRPPFWLTWWFILLEVVVIAGIVGVVVNARQRAVRQRREKELAELRSRMLALEQQSLNSSMNRHFIFNALNSIQYYINRQDRLAANRYLSDFARLIRKNLDSSQENLTSLREEIERLELYLKLEHMRFRDKFEYSIHIDPSLNQDEVKVPAMLLQPFLENSIWHGLLPKEAPGRIDVDIHRKNGHIEFTITDNGVGIEQSIQSKTGTDSHISKGMQITGNRIELIKKMTGETIELRGPYQLHDDSGRPAGTRVEIIMPLNFQQLFGE